jgi:hypothetical protein
MKAIFNAVLKLIVGYYLFLLLKYIVGNILFPLWKLFFWVAVAAILIYLGMKLKVIAL